MKLKSIIFLSVTLFLLSNCKSKAPVVSKVETKPQSNPVPAELLAKKKENDFIISQDSGLFLTDANLKIQFLGIIQDDRCPVNQNCLWAGNARVSINVNGQSFTLDTQNLKSNNLNKSIFVNGYTYTLEALYPEREAHTTNTKSSILLKIEKGKNTGNELRL